MICLFIHLCNQIFKYSNIQIFADFSNAKTIGLLPLKLMRQSIRQLEFLRNVWLNVLADNVYINTFSSLLNDIARDIIKRIMSLEDISAVVANELSELIDILLEKTPPLFKVIFFFF